MSQPMRLLFRVDASLQIGTGHVIRCLTLAEHLKSQGAQVEFASRLLEGHLCDLIEGRGFVVHRLPAPTVKVVPSAGAPVHAAWLGVASDEDVRQTRSVVEAAAGFDWLVVDHYGIDLEWQQGLRIPNLKLMIIDDLADRLHHCDLLLDQNLVADLENRYLDLIPPGCPRLLGPAFALLQQDYARLRPRAAVRKGAVRRLLVSFGGVDQAGLTEMTVNALLTLNQVAVEADIVLSSASPQFTRIAKLVADKPGFRLHDRVPGLAPLILAADLAVGASGTTNWERLSLGLPAIVVTVAANQRPSAAELQRRGLIRWLGDAADVHEATLRAALDEALSENLDGVWSQRCLEVVDGRGADRVAAILLAGPNMELVVRPVVLDDEALLLDWANDQETRRNAFNPKPISPDEHRAWFSTRLRCLKDCVLFIVQTRSAIPLGQVRFDRRESLWEISYSVAPAFRGRRIGRAMLSAAIDTFRLERMNAPIFGQVKPDNMASRRIFEQLGFSARQSGPDRIVFELGT